MLGLSPATVSLALRGDAAVAEATRKRVLDAAVAHGYRPNAALALALARGKGRVKSVRTSVAIAFLRSTTDDAITASTSWHKPFAGLSKKAEERGFVAEDFNVRRYGSMAEVRHMLFHRGFQAVVLGAFWDRRDLLSQDWSPFVMAEVGRHDVEPRVHCVRRDEAATVRLICRKIKEGGFKRPLICLRNHEPRLDDDRDREGAWLVEADNSAAEIWRGEFSAQDGAKLAARVRARRADVVVGFNGGDLWKLREAGLKPGKNFTYWQMQVDDTESGVTGMRDDLKLMGELALPLVERLLHAGLLGVPTAAQDIVLQPEWIEGNPG